MSDAVKPALHGRDHCPGGVDPIPCLGGQSFRALLYNISPGSNITVGGSTLVDIVYNDWLNDNPGIFAPKTSLGADPELGTDLVQRVELLAPGIYVISWGVHYTAIFDGTVAQAIHDADPIFGRADMLVHGPANYNSQTFSTVGYFTQTITRVYTLMDPFGSGSWTPEIATDTAQTSGSSRTVDEAWLEIHYFAAKPPVEVA